MVLNVLSNHQATKKAVKKAEQVLQGCAKQSSSNEKSSNKAEQGGISKSSSISQS
jgi:hypothetical protein